MTKDDCELECFMNADCVSYNFGTNQTAGEKRGTVCELSDSTADIHPCDVKNRTGFSYTPAEVRLLSTSSSQYALLSSIVKPKHKRILVER